MVGFRDQQIHHDTRGLVLRLGVYPALAGHRHTDVDQHIAGLDVAADLPAINCLFSHSMPLLRMPIFQNGGGVTWFMKRLVVTTPFSTLVVQGVSVHFLLAYAGGVHVGLVRSIRLSIIRR